MDIRYKSRRLEEQCTNRTKAVKKYGERNAQKIFQRVQEIRSADSVEMLVKFNIGRCHPLTGNRAGQYAMDLDHPFRLIFEKVENEIKIVKIIEVVDYH